MEPKFEKRCLIQQLPATNAERLGDLLDRRNAGVTVPPLDIANVGPMQVDLEAELLLRQHPLTPQTTQIPRQPLLDVRHGLDRPKCRRAIYRPIVTILLDASGSDAIRTLRLVDNQAVAQARSCGPFTA